MPATKNQWYEIIRTENGIRTVINGTKFKYKIVHALSVQYQYFQERGLVASYERGLELHVKLLPSGAASYRVVKKEELKS